jgi:peroxiredoxin Q/BCP
MPRLQTGDRIPDLTVTDHQGEQLSLAQLCRNGPLVLFFYPKDDSPVCTKEACSFRDAYEDFLAEGATVIGISGDSTENHASFASRHALPFHLVADGDGAVRKAFGVPKSMGLLPGRVTYVIDTQGVIRHVFSAQFAAERHVQEALEAIRQRK